MKKIKINLKKMSEKNQMNFQQHFSELRKRIIFSLIFFVICFCVSYFFSEKIYQILLEPFAKVLEEKNNYRLIYTSPTEAFITYLKLSFYGSLFFSLPIFLTEIYLFLSPALYKNEKKNIFFIFISSFFLFLAGGIFCYFFVLPLALKFFVSFETQGFAQGINLPIILETKISEYLNFLIKLLFGFGIAFMSPIFLFFILKVGLVSINDLKKKRRYWIIGIFIIAAILTPPDVLSQISMAVLMIFLFEIVLLIGQNLNNKK